MGIPRLTSYLQPYFTSTVLGCSNHDCSLHKKRSTGLIIDGPGLIYAIYYRLLAWKPASLNALDAQPSYREIGNATVQFLEQLTACGIAMYVFAPSEWVFSAKAIHSEKIYFDGYLPTQKRAVRISRLESYLRQLVSYHANNKDFRSGNYGGDESLLSVESLFDFARPVPAKFRGLPAAPFLVPAALERLARSQFADVVEVVAGEADFFCAATARMSGGFVVTGDSDLLVYDLGPDGGVVFLEQLELRPCDGSPGEYCLTTNMAISHEICQRLDIENVQRLAFELKEDPSITLQEAVQRSKKDIGLTGKRIYYHLFQKEYATETVRSLNEKTCSGIGASQILDPRLSELALQCDDAQQNTVYMYLPFLIEDPSRASAWGVSSGLRSLAYTLLAGLDRQRSVPCILEYSRRDVRIVATSVCILDNSELILSAKMMNRKLVAIHNQFATLSPAETWNIFGLIEVFSSYVDRGRALPSRPAFSKLFRSSEGNIIAWQDVQLSAMVQAALYSTRLLKQALHLVNSSGTTRLESDLSALDSCLEKLPSLQELIPSRHHIVDLALLGLEPDTVFDFVKKWAQTAQDDNDRDESAGSLDLPPNEPNTPLGKVESETAWIAVKSKHTKLKRKNNVVRDVETVVVTPAKRVPNIYGMLADTSYDS